MAEVQADLVLSVDQALSEIQALGDLITEVTTGVTVDAQVQVDTAQAEAEVAAIDAPPIEVPVDVQIPDIDLLDSIDFEGLQAAVDSIQVEPIEVEVQADTAQAEQAVSGLSSEASGLTASFDGAADSASLFGFSLGAASKSGAALAAVGLAAFAIDSAGAFAEAEGVIATTTQVIENLGPAAGISIQGVQALATTIQQYSGISDEAIISAAGLVAQLGSVKNAAGEGNDIFDRTITLSADLATVFGTDITGAARGLARALADPARGLSRLERQIGPFDAAVKENILSLQEQGDTLGAQRLILETLEERIGGVAQAYGGSLRGELDRAGEAFGEFQEDVGQVAGEALPLLTIALQGLSGVLAIIGPVVRAFGTGLAGIGAALSLIPTPILAIAAAFVTLIAGARAAVTALLLLQAANPVTLGILAAAAAVTALGAALGLMDSQAEDSAAALFLTQDALDQSTQAAQSLAAALNEGGQVALVDEVLNRLIEISPEVVAALNETEQGVSGLVELIQSGVSVSGPGEAIEQLIEGAGLTGEAADEARAQLALLANQVAISGSAADAMSTAEQRSAEALGQTAEQAQAAQAALQRLADSAVGNLPTLGDAIGNVEDGLSTFGQTLTASTDPQLVIDNLFQMVQAFANFSDNLAGFDATPLVQQALAGLGPEVAGAFTQSLADAPQAVRNQLELVLQVAQSEGLNIVEVLTGAGSSAAEGYAGEIGALPGVTGRATQGAIGEVNSRRRNARDAGAGVGAGMTEGTRSGAAGMGPAARAAVGAATEAVRAGAGAAFSGGYSVGIALTAGITSGIAAGSFNVVQSARNVIDQAVQAARDEAQISSPSKVFQEIGEQMGAGMAIGLADATAVVAAAEALTFAAAGAVPVGAGSGGGSLSMGDTIINVDATGSTDPKGVASAVDTALANHRRKIDVLYRQRKG